LVIVTFVAYQPAWRAGFIWDDDDHLTKNVAVLSANGWKQIWSSLEYSRYYPLTLTSFWLEHQLWGLRPLPYHAVNIALQAANALLLWVLLRRLRVPGAWMAAALWAVHPVNVETVAWVTELKNTQSGFFLLLALLLFLRFEDRWHRRDYVLAVICGAAAMASKPSSVVLPAVILLCAWWRRGHCGLRDFRRVAPLAALAAGMSLLTVIEQRHHITGQGTPEWTFTVAQRLALASRAPWFYAGKVLWPFHVCFVYPRWELKTDSLAAWVPLTGLVLAAATLWRFRGRWWARGAIFGLGCFVVALLPVLGFFNIYFFRYSFVADHFQYLASAAIIALLAAAAARLAEKMPPPWVAANRRTGAVVLTILAALTYRQSQTYATSEKLYRSTIARNPRCWMAYNNLGATLLEQGRLDEAIDNLQHGLQFKPHDAGVRNNLGTAFFRQGKSVEAVSQYRESTRLQPDYPDAHYNLGNALSELNHLNEAEAEYRDAIRYDPDYADAHYNLANTLVRLNRPTEALPHYQVVTRLRPTDVDAWFALANILGQQGNLAGALAGYQRTLQLKPDFVDAHYNLANALVRAANTNEAIAQYQIAVQLKPDLVPAQFNLAMVLLASGNARESVDHFQQVIALKPDLAPAYYKLAVAWVRLGRFESATNCCDRALRLNPEYPEALADCAWLLATHDPISAGDNTRALKLAVEACRLTGNRDPSALATLSAVYASAGQFTNAVATVEAALALLGNSSGGSPVREQFKNQLAQYRAGLPCRITLPAALPSDW
jgi:tetratricopeptide (TPR) repeat protein